MRSKIQKLTKKTMSLSLNSGRVTCTPWATIWDDSANRKGLIFHSVLPNHPGEWTTINSIVHHTASKRIRLTYFPDPVRVNFLADINFELYLEPCDGLEITGQPDATILLLFTDISEFDRVDP